MKTKAERILELIKIVEEDASLLTAEEFEDICKEDDGSEYIDVTTLDSKIK